MNFFNAGQLFTLEYIFYLKKYEGQDGLGLRAGGYEF